MDASSCTVPCSVSPVWCSHNEVNKKLCRLLYLYPCNLLLFLKAGVFWPLIQRFSSGASPKIAGGYLGYITSELSPFINPVWVSVLNCLILWFTLMLLMKYYFAVTFPTLSLSLSFKYDGISGDIDSSFIKGVLK